MMKQSEEEVAIITGAATGGGSELFAETKQQPSNIGFMATYIQPD